MSGTPERPGINTRALQALFDMLGGAQRQQQQQQPLVEVAMVQFYCEHVFDLLAADSTQRLEVCNLAAGQLARGQERVSGLVWKPVATSDEALVRARHTQVDETRCGVNVGACRESVQASLGCTVLQQLVPGFSSRLTSVRTA